MILINYIEPFITIHSDQLVSGELIIKGDTNKILWSNNFQKSYFINVKVQSSWPKNIVVILKTDKYESKKAFSF